MVAWFLSTPRSARFDPNCDVPVMSNSVCMGHTDPELLKTSPEKGRRAWKCPSDGTQQSLLAAVWDRRVLGIDASLRTFYVSHLMTVTGLADTCEAVG